MKILASKRYIIRLLDTLEDDSVLYDYLYYMQSSVMHEYPFIDIEVPSSELCKVIGFIERQGWAYRLF